MSNFDAQGNDTGPGWGWAVMALPQMEQISLFNAINLNLPIEAPDNQTTRLTSLALFLCPSDVVKSPWSAYSRNLNGNPIAMLCQLAPANYVGVFGTSDPGIDGDGVFYRDSAVRFSDVLDGTSNTFSVGERSFALGEATWAGFVTGAVLYPDNNDGIGYPRAESGPGMILGQTGGGHGPGDPTAEVNQFYSLHFGGGVQFLFVDGHVAVLKKSINYNTYRALSTRAGGEVIPGDY